MIDQTKLLKTVAMAFAAFIFTLGFYWRVVDIHHATFFLFDEGYYLNFNRRFVEIAARFAPTNFPDFIQAFWTLIRVSLGTGKALWFFIVDGRVFLGLAHAWYFPKIISMLAGFGTVAMTYLFARRYFKSKELALLSAALLIILPSHIFYSRLGIQEALSGLFFLSGFYFYLFPRSFGWRTFFSALLFVGAYFTNYRLIFIPAMVFLTELFLSWAGKGKFDLRKFFWHTLAFGGLLLSIACLDRAQNIEVTFTWMSHQAELAKSEVDLLNFLSYPYYLFKLESFAFGLVFWASAILVLKKEWMKSFPFLFVVVLMGIFSLTEDKAARYLCVGLPFSVMAVAVFWAEIYKKCADHSSGKVIVIATVILLLSLCPNALMIATAKSDYEQSVKDVLSQQNSAKFVSTQPWVQRLFVPQAASVAAAPHTFEQLVDFYQKGFDYLVIDPQSYVSYTQSKNKFDTHLENYLGFVNGAVKPIRIYPHFNEIILERFVFEHNENLRRSLAFLKEHGRGLGTLRVYSVKECIDTVVRELSDK